MQTDCNPRNKRANITMQAIIIFIIQLKEGLAVINCYATQSNTCDLYREYVTFFKDLF